MEPKAKISKELLEEMYLKKKYSVRKIANVLKIKSSNSITQYLKKYNLKREPNTIVRYLTKEYLQENYVNLGKSARQIARELGSSQKKTVLDAIHKFKLKRTGFSQDAIKEYKKRRTGHPEISGKIWHEIKQGAITRKLPFLITRDDVWAMYLKQDKKCALSGVDIRFTSVTEPTRNRTASVDRIDSSKGYTLDNIQIVHKKVNRMKWDLKQQEFIEMCERIYRFNNDNSIHQKFTDWVI